MAFLGETFDTTSLPEGRSYDPVPEGWYNATISKADVMPTKAGTGTKIDLRYDITGPAQQGRAVFSALNIRNPNPKSEEIGRQQLGDIMRAIGLARLEDSDQLVGAQLQIKVKHRAPTDSDRAAGYNDTRVEVAGWKALAGAPMPAPAAKPAAPAPAASAKPPWAK
jgi:hypothetical protein